MQFAALAGACMLLAGCTDVVDGNAGAGEKAGLVNRTPIPVSALDNLMLDTSQINSALGATSMKVWFNAKGMWDWSKNVDDEKLPGGRRRRAGQGLLARIFRGMPM